MAHAYTPGLKVEPCLRLRRRRLLPIPGEVLVKAGDKVEARQEVAQTKLPGKVHLVNVANRLGIAPDELKLYMLKKPGDPVEAREALAENKPFISFLKTVVPSPIKGSVESVSEITGQVLLREPPRLLPLTAYIDGTVVEVLEKFGVVVETEGAFVQGIFGVGGETHGELAVAAREPGEELLPASITEAHKGKVVVGGAHAGWDALQRVKAVGAAGVIVGGIHDKDLRALLGYDIGVAVTGTENIGFTLIVTEGFGTIPMARHTFGLLKAHHGEKASISGATQIRAGVLRPEIIIPGSPKPGDKVKTSYERGALSIGDEVRVIREPHFGRIGRVAGLPPELTRIASESKVRVLELTFESGEKLVIPRANVEICSA